MHDLSAVVARLEKLERENRRLKIVGGAVVAVLAAVALVGAVVPQGGPAVLNAMMIELVDVDGNTTARLNGLGFWLIENDGSPAAAMMREGFSFSHKGGSGHFGIRQPMDPDTGALMPEPRAVLRNPEGNVIWQAPR